MIKGLKPKLAEGGKIKIGCKGEERQSQRGTYRLPQKQDHFTITTMEREDNSPDGNLIRDDKIMDLLADEYADKDGKIRTLPIVLHSDDIDLVFPTAYVCYTGQSVICRGDGETAQQRIVDAAGPHSTAGFEEVKCPCDRLKPDAKGVRRCKHSGTLHCSIRVEDQAVAGAVHRWRTTSQISCEQMYGSLLQIVETVGVLQGLPLVLRVRPVRVDPPGGRPTDVYVCHVELRATDLQSVQRQALELAQMRGALSGQVVAEQARNYRAMLQAPGTGTDEELADEGRELYPNAVIDTPPADVPESPPAPERLSATAQGLAPKRLIDDVRKELGLTGDDVTAVLKEQNAPDDHTTWTIAHVEQYCVALKARADEQGGAYEGEEPPPVGGE